MVEIEQMQGYGTACTKVQDESESLLISHLRELWRIKLSKRFSLLMLATGGQPRPRRSYFIHQKINDTMIFLTNN